MTEVESRTEPIPVTPEQGDDKSPAWSPDGTLLSFATNRDGNFGIYVTEVANLSRQFALTKHTGDDRMADYSPAWSFHGREIAFHRSYGRNAGDDIHIYTMNADESGPQIPVTKDRGVNVFPAWSPVDLRLAFQTKRDGENREIYVVSTVGPGEDKNLSNSPAFDADPAW